LGFEVATICSWYFCSQSPLRKIYAAGRLLPICDRFADSAVLPVDAVAVDQIRSRRRVLPAGFRPELDQLGQL
jgi:hypothetical protein